MPYQIKPLTEFMRYSDYRPLSRTQYEALSRPRPGTVFPETSDRVDLSTKTGRAALVRTITGSLGIDSRKSLLQTLIPPAQAIGGSYGLYAGVEEIPAYKMRSLIDKHV